MKRKLTMLFPILFSFLFLFLIPMFKVALADPTINTLSVASHGQELRVLISGLTEIKPLKLTDEKHIQKSCVLYAPSLPDGIVVIMPNSGTVAYLFLVNDCSDKNPIGSPPAIKAIQLVPSTTTTGTCTINSSGQLTSDSCKSGYVPYVDFGNATPVCECKNTADARCNASTPVSAIGTCSSTSLTNPIRCGANLSGYSCQKTNQNFCMNGVENPDNVVCQTVVEPQSCCESNYIFDSSSKVCEAKSGSSGHGKFLCASGTGCNATTQQCEAGGTRAFIPPAGTDICEGGVCKTAIGDIPTSPAGLIGRLFSVLLGLSGGIALILIIISGYRLMTSGANAEAVQGARETLTSAIVGLLFIIFSLVILEVIGVDILKIPGLKP